MAHQIDHPWEWVITPSEGTGLQVVEVHEDYHGLWFRLRWPSGLTTADGWVRDLLFWVWVDGHVTWERFAPSPVQATEATVEPEPEAVEPANDAPVEPANGASVEPGAS